MIARPWSRADERELDELREERLSLAAIAQRTGRTVDSVRNKAHKMDRAREGKPPYAKARSVRVLRRAASVELADELIRRGWSCTPPRR